MQIGYDVATAAPSCGVYFHACHQLSRFVGLMSPESTGFQDCRIACHQRPSLPPLAKKVSMATIQIKSDACFEIIIIIDYETEQYGNSIDHTAEETATSA